MKEEDNNLRIIRKGNDPDAPRRKPEDSAIDVDYDDDRSESVTPGTPRRMKA